MHPDRPCTGHDERRHDRRVAEARRDTARRIAGACVRLRGLDYKWIALSNTTLGMLIATINASILLIALPNVFRGIGIDRCSQATPAICCG